MCDPARAFRLTRAVDPASDHVVGGVDAPITLIEYGSYACGYCRTAHDVVRRLRDRFGDRMRYVYRHLPLADRAEATRAAELVEYAEAASGRFWEAHDQLMRGAANLQATDLERVREAFDVPPRDAWDPDRARAVAARVRGDARSGLESGARVTPTFFINGRRYEGAWDEASLGEAMLRSLGHRLQAASLDFARWAPSTGVLLLLMTLLAIAISNGPEGAAFLSLWEQEAGVRFGGHAFALTLIDWVNHGALTVFFLVVGLEIKRELSVGRLASRRAAALPLAAAVGGMAAPALLFLALAPPGIEHAWGLSMTTDTAFAVALIVVLGDRVPVDLRVFLTAAVIVDDLVAIVIVALFYSSALDARWLAIAGVLAAVLVLFSRSHIYRALPYAVVGTLLWYALHESGIHATLAGVILAMATPTRSPPDLTALMAQARAVIEAETRSRGEQLLRSGPSEPALRALDAIHDRLESPADKLLRSVEPWSSYFVLPLFALANAGIVWSSNLLDGHGQLVATVVVSLVLGKFIGILGGAALAVRLGLASKPSSYTWRQLAGAAALGGIGFTMSLFIAHQAMTGEDFAATKVAIFIASLVAAALGLAMLWKRPPTRADEVVHGDDDAVEIGTPARTAA